MFDHILVGVDARDGGRDAIALAKNLLGASGRLTLANVYPGEAYVWRGGSPAYQAVQQEDAISLLKRAREEAGLEAELCHVASQSIGRGLHELAERTGADLIVVGSSRRGLLGRVMLGDDTQSALGGAPSAVAVAPAGYAHERGIIREIGVGYDGSPESEHALAVARELAERHGSRLSAFQAVSLPAYLFIGGPAPIGESEEKVVLEARERIAALGGVEPHAAYGIPADELALYSASLDLLVVGARDYGPVGRLIHGSTSRQLARKARCPLLILTRAGRAAVLEARASHEPAAAQPAA